MRGIPPGGSIAPRAAAARAAESSPAAGPASRSTSPRPPARPISRWEPAWGRPTPRTQVLARTGDRILLVTDGVLEAPAPDGTEFGDAGVEQVLTSCLANGSGCDGLATALVDALRAHTGRDPMEHDDVSFYVAEIVPTPPGPQVWQIVKNRLLAPVFK